MDLRPAFTMPLAKMIFAFATFQIFAACAAMRSLITSAALRAAMPLRSEPEDAAVGDVLGTLPVVVAVMATCSRAMPKTSATTCATF